MRIYLAQPYAHTDPATRSWRAKAGAVAAAYLAEKNYAVFAPVPYSVTLAPHLVFAGEHSFWMDFDLPWLLQANEMWILPLPGWEKSKGVLEEIHTANIAGVFVRFLALTSTARCDLDLTGAYQAALDKAGPPPFTGACE